MPRLFTGAPKLVKKNPLTVSFQYSPKANLERWQPGHVRRLACTWQVYINPQNNVVSRTGYEDIKSVTCKGKSCMIVFKKVYADWESLRQLGVYQAQKSPRNQDMNKAWLNSVPVSSGPWRFQSWQKGVQITRRRRTRGSRSRPR